MHLSYEVLRSIYPEIVVSDHTVTLDIPVIFSDPVDCEFSTKPRLRLQYLPSLKLCITTTEGNPVEISRLELRCVWLSEQWLSTLRAAIVEKYPLEEDNLYAIIDELHDSACTAFGLLLGGSLQVDDVHYESLSVFNESTARKVFDDQLHECGICFVTDKGSACIALHGQHVFCVSCLRSMISLHIKEGAIGAIRCPACPSRTIADTSSSKISVEILRRLVSNEEVDRYLDLSRKQELEALPNTIHCPRDFCAQPLARDPDEKLAICTKCEYAFCADCGKTWHGPSEPCRRQMLSSALAEEYMALKDDESQKLQLLNMQRLYGRKNLDRLVHDYENEKLTSLWRAEHAQPCPVCLNYIEKSMGCNHIICSICASHFCFLCGESLNSNNPYKHYSDERLSCYKQLFAGLTGLEDPYEGVLD